MKNWTRLLLALFVLNSVYSVYGQREGKRFKINGEIRFSSFHQGGVDQGDIKPEEYPLSNEIFVLVRLDSLNALPKRVSEFTTDEDGSFKLKVPAGMYGIILKKDLEEIVSGQYLPASLHSGDSGYSTSITWRISGDKPIYISNANSEKIILVRHARSVCHLCP